MEYKYKLEVKNYLDHAEEANFNRNNYVWEQNFSEFKGKEPLDDYSAQPLIFIHLLTC